MIIEEKEEQSGKKTIEERWNELNNAVPDKKDSNRRATAGAGQWVQDSHTAGGGTNTSGQFGHSVQRTDIDTDLNGAYFQPIEIGYTPAKFKYNPDDPDGLLAQFKKYAKKPEWDAEREKRLKAVARVNALGDLFKHLGAFAGGGYAPVEKRQENKNVLRAFAELDKMRDLYDNRMDRYNDKQEGWLMTGLNTARQAHEAGENRRLQTILKNADYKAQARSVQREAKLRDGTTTTTDNYAGSKSAATNYQDGSRTMAVPKGSGSGSGSGKSTVFTYRDTDGEINLDKSRLTQFYSTLEKNRDRIKKMPIEERVKLGIGDDQTIDKDLEIMIAGLTGKISLNDANFQRIASKYMDAFRNSDMMKYVLAGTFTPYSEKPDFVPPRTFPYEGANATPTGSSSAPESVPLQVSEACLTDLNKIVKNETIDKQDKRKAIIDRLKQEGYSKEEVKRIVESITVE